MPDVCGLAFMRHMVRFLMRCGLMRRLLSSTDRELLKLFNSVWLVLSNVRGKAVCDILIVKMCFICWKRRSSKSYLNNLVWDMLNYYCVSILSNIDNNTVTNVVRPRLTLVNRSRIVSWSLFGSYDANFLYTCRYNKKNDKEVLKRVTRNIQIKWQRGAWCIFIH